MKKILMKLMIWTITSMAIVQPAQAGFGSWLGTAGWSDKKQLVTWLAGGALLAASGIMYLRNMATAKELARERALAHSLYDEAREMFDNLQAGEAAEAPSLAEAAFAAADSMFTDSKCDAKIWTKLSHNRLAMQQLRDKFEKELTALGLDKLDLDNSGIDGLKDPKNYCEKFILAIKLAGKFGYILNRCWWTTLDLWGTISQYEWKPTLADRMFYAKVREQAYALGSKLLAERRKVIAKKHNLLTNTLLNSDISWRTPNQILLLKMRVELWERLDEISKAQSSELANWKRLTDGGKLNPAPCGEEPRHIVDAEIYYQQALCAAKHPCVEITRLVRLFERVIARAATDSYAYKFDAWADPDDALVPPQEITDFLQPENNAKAQLIIARVFAEELAMVEKVKQGLGKAVGDTAKLAVYKKVIAPLWNHVLTGYYLLNATCDFVGTSQQRRAKWMCATKPVCAAFLQLLSAVGKLVADYTTLRINESKNEAERGALKKAEEERAAWQALIEKGTQNCVSLDQAPYRMSAA